MTGDSRDFYDSRQELSEEDKKKFNELLKPLIDKYGHELVRDLYHLSHQIRTEFELTYIPISRIYRASLFRMIETEYSELSTGQIAKKEGLKERTAYNLISCFWRLKRKNR